jgi:CRISPR-associated protein Csb2
MPLKLVISVRVHGGRFHGQEQEQSREARLQWPPSPMRLFQALVAGAADWADVPAHHAESLEWLEALPAPVIAAPAKRDGKAHDTFVPNNSLDAFGNDPARVAEIRVAKSIKPAHFDENAIFHYIWDLPDDVETDTHTAQLNDIAERLYQFGRGVDMAWATTAVIYEAAVTDLLGGYVGSVHKPTANGNGQSIICPRKGTFESLVERYAENQQRLSRQEGKITVFRQARKPVARQVIYDAADDYLLFMLRDPNKIGRTGRWALTDISALAERVRGDADFGLFQALRDNGYNTTLLERLVIGRGAIAADIKQRLRIVPLPSIGMAHTDPAIRRILVVRPPDCPFGRRELETLLSGLDIIAPDTGEILASLRTVTTDDKMLTHYGVGKPARVWRSVTPLALGAALRRRLAPGMQETKSGGERSGEEQAARTAVMAALRHEDILASVESIRVQREPWHRRGARAEKFSGATRFSKHTLWHVEIVFRAPQSGPLVLGDGRYLGLGLMAPTRDLPRSQALPVNVDAFVFAIDPATLNKTDTASADLIHATRRALMSLSAAQNGGHPLPLFSGHAADGAPLHTGDHRHIYIVADGIKRLLIIAPWAADRRMTPTDDERTAFQKTVSALRLVRAGAIGAVRGDMHPLWREDKLFAESTSWSSRTPYRLTRFPKPRSDKDAFTAFAKADIRADCVRRELPEIKEIRVERIKTEVSTGDKEKKSRQQPRVNITLIFKQAVRGPLLLGSDCHAGGGYFLPAKSE